MQREGVSVQVCAVRVSRRGVIEENGASMGSWEELKVDGLIDGKQRRDGKK